MRKYNNEEGVAEVLEEYYDKYTRIAHIYIKDKNDAKSVIHDTFLNLLKRGVSELPDQKENLKKYIYVAVKRQAIVSYNKSKSWRKIQSLVRAKNPNEEFTQNQISQEVRQLINCLDDPRHITILTYFLQGYSHKEIVDKMPTVPSVGASKVLLHRAKIALRELLENDNPDPDRGGGILPVDKKYRKHNNPNVNYNQQRELGIKDLAEIVNSNLWLKDLSVYDMLNNTRERSEKNYGLLSVLDVDDSDKVFDLGKEDDRLLFPVVGTDDIILLLNVFNYEFESLDVDVNDGIIFKTDSLHSYANPGESKRNTCSYIDDGDEVFGLGKENNRRLLSIMGTDDIVPLSNALDHLLESLDVDENDGIIFKTDSLHSYANSGVSIRTVDWYIDNDIETFHLDLAPLDRVRKDYRSMFEYCFDLSSKTNIYSYIDNDDEVFDLVKENYRLLSLLGLGVDDGNKAVDVNNIVLPVRKDYSSIFEYYFDLSSRTNICSYIDDGDEVFDENDGIIFKTDSLHSYASFGASRRNISWYIDDGDEVFDLGKDILIKAVLLSNYDNISVSRRSFTNYMDKSTRAYLTWTVEPNHLRLDSSSQLDSLVSFYDSLVLDTTRDFHPEIYANRLCSKTE